MSHCLVVALMLWLECWNILLLFCYGWQLGDPKLVRPQRWKVLSKALPRPPGLCAALCGAVAALTFHQGTPPTGGPLVFPHLDLKSHFLWVPGVPLGP